MALTPLPMAPPLPLGPMSPSLLQRSYSPKKKKPHRRGSKMQESAYTESDYAQLPSEVKTWIKDHPYQTAFYVVNGVVLFAPGLLAGPLLGALGWTSLGPRAGKFRSVRLLRFRFALVWLG